MNTIHPRPVALITGAGRRVGAVIARTLHSAGYDLALHYRPSADAAEALAAELEQQRASSTVLVQASLQGIYSAALFRYAETGQAGQGFDPAMLEQAFRPKG